VSKGSKSRISNKQAFDEGFDRIFRKKEREKPYINEYGDDKVLIIDDEGNKYTEEEKK
tara:strand:- start:819 stop:992 length:174 start_codon:yes stop_codon:yes gene_type:complete